MLSLVYDAIENAILVLAIAYTQCRQAEARECECRPCVVSYYDPITMTETRTTSVGLCVHEEGVGHGGGSNRGPFLVEQSVVLS